jgi:superfamily II DNA or RNA helicase
MMMLLDWNIKIDGNPISHLFSADSDNCTETSIRLAGGEAIRVVSETGQRALVLTRKVSRFGRYDVVFLKRQGGYRLIRSRVFGDPVRRDRLSEIRESWEISTSLVPTNDGLRAAQRGALLAIFSHWTKSDAPATVVMPTGTGKTETLLATIVAGRPRCALVIVPTDPLRSQFFQKAVTWGRLRGLGVLSTRSLYPVVGMLKSGCKSTAGLKSIATNCHIVVTTMQILSRIQPDELDVIREHFDLVAVDEAHHLAAPSWSKVVDNFSKSKILQFTATPFRYDGKHIGGEIIYAYPLARCQQEGFFRHIDFLAITEFFDDKADQAICETAVARLREDISAGYQHALMARTSTKERAREVFSLYRDRHADLKPVMIYSGMKMADKEKAKSSLLNGSSKVVVCVNMLGEGFDYAPLKVAAIHDPHKSLPITLQFIGRFTRTGDRTIGDASVVANIADPAMQANVSSLYSQDADWDSIIRGSYENAVGHEVEFQRFINSFIFDGIEGFSVRNIRPKFSAYVYSVSGDVGFDRLKAKFNDGTVYRLAINEVARVAVIIHKQNLAVEWGRILELVNTNYICHCLYHDEKNGLVFIFTSGGDAPDTLAATVSDASTRIMDRKIHRCLHGINRLMLTNVGLKKILSGPIRYRNYMGLDVGQGLRERISENTYTAVLFGFGYENAEKANVGCSLKGKIWSRNAGSMLAWIDWCSRVGSKIVDEEINPETILDGVLFPEAISEIPAERVIIQADWSDFFFENMFEKTDVEMNTIEHEIEECSVVVDEGRVDDHTVRFALIAADSRIIYDLILTNAGPEGYGVSCKSTQDCAIVVGKASFTGAEFFTKYPPQFWLDDSSLLVDGCLLVQSHANQTGGVYDVSSVQTRDWSGIDIQVESQGDAKRADSIQRAMIEEAIKENPLFVFDDDGSGEAADIIALYELRDTLLVRLYHCKYSSAQKPGRRIEDIYELCGQAVKSVKWASSVKLLTNHLRRREKLRMRNARPSGFQTGDFTALSSFSGIARQKRVRYESVLVQPGLSKKALSSGTQGAGSILRLLGGTAAYLAETFEMGMRLMVSK